MFAPPTPPRPLPPGGGVCTRGGAVVQADSPVPDEQPLSGGGAQPVPLEQRVHCAAGRTAQVCHCMGVRVLGGGRGRLAGWGVTSRRCHGPRQGKVTRRLCAPPRAQGDGGAVGCGRAGAQCQAPLEPGSAQPHAQRAQDAHRTGRPVILASSATARGCRVTAGRCVITPRRGGVCGCGLAAVLARSLTPGPARAAGG